MSAIAAQDRAEWLEWRRQGVGASDIAAILGISPWSSPWSVWADKAGLLPDEQPSEDMEGGKWLELAIAPWFAHRTGLHVAGEQTWLSHPTEPWMRCTVDGFVIESAGGIDFDPWQAADLGDALGLLEIKTARPGRAWDEIPSHYQAQGQWQMAVSNTERVWFAVLMGRRLDVYELTRDQADIDFMAERAERFWRDHVLTGTPPPTDGHDATLRALSTVYPEHTPGVSVEVNPTVVNEWRKAKARRKAAEASERVLAAEIQAVLGDAEEGTVEGRRVVSWRTQVRKSYTVAESTMRVLRPHQPKERT